MRYCLAVVVLTGYASRGDCMVEEPIFTASPMTMHAPMGCNNEAEFICAAVRMAEANEWVSVALWRDYWGEAK